MNVLAIDLSQKTESLISENLDSVFYHSRDEKGPKKSKPDIIIVGGSEQNGSHEKGIVSRAELFKSLKKRYETTPLIFLSESSKSSERIEALNAGADDCIQENRLDGAVLKCRIQAIERGYK